MFLAFLLLTVITVLFALSVATEKKQSLLQDYFLYREADKLVSQKKMGQAEVILQGLVQKYPESDKVNWQYGICLAVTGKLQQGSEHMKRALELSPGLAKNPANLLGYGQVLFSLGDYKNAERYLLKSKEANLRAEDLVIADKYLEKIQEEIK